MTVEKRPGGGTNKDIGTEGKEGSKETQYNGGIVQ